jgi:short-subunit dehydrogenase
MTTTKTILITGATAGIGRHAALHLARRGHHVIATGRNEKALAALAASGASLRLDTVRLDVTDAESIARAVFEVDRLTEGRGLDVLVNNAGYGHAGAIADLGDEDLRAQFETNVFGLMAVTRAFLPRMLARRAGRIVNLSSIGGRITMPFFGAYHASKYAVEALSDSLRLELVPFGVDVSIVEPGPIRSEFSNRSVEVINKVSRPDSPWAAVYARAEEVQAMSDRNAFDPIHTSRAIEKAATARRPRVRYVVPGRLAPVLALLRALPARLVDALMRRAIGMTPRRLAQTSTVPPVDGERSAA